MVTDPDNWHEYKGHHSRGYYDIILKDGSQFTGAWGDPEGFHVSLRVIPPSSVSMIRRSERRGNAYQRRLYGQS